MDKQKLSIISPFHNAQATLKECLNSILQSNYKDYELIVVDDGSTDKSKNIAESLGCHVVELQENKGAAAARNCGAREAKNNIVLFIDSDIVIKLDSLSKIIARFLENENLAGVVGVYSFQNRFSNFLSQYKHMVACYREQKCKDVNEDSFKSCFFAIKKDIFDKYKFDETFKKASIEDIEFGRKLIDLGYKFIMDKSNDVEHVKRFTVKSFFENQYNRSKDIASIYLKRKSFGFYQSSKRENRYAKSYFLRVPLAGITSFFLALVLVTRNQLALICLAFLSLAPIFIERDFLKFCYVQRGPIFTMGCMLVYFYDGFISGLGALSAVVDKYMLKELK